MRKAQAVRDGRKETRYDPFGHCSGRRHPWRERKGRNSRDGGDNEAKAPGLPPLDELNRLVQDPAGLGRVASLEPLIWHRWLWGTPPAETGGGPRGHTAALCRWWRREDRQGRGGGAAVVNKFPGTWLAEAHPRACVRVHVIKSNV